jgi:hypothetical protein
MRRISIAAAVLALLAVACKANLDARLSQELDRLDISLKKLEASKLPAELADLPEGHRARIAGACAATSPELRLYRMRDAFIGVELLSVLSEQKRAGEDLQALNALWSSQRERFVSAAPELHGPLLIRALEESAQNRAQKLYRASLPYGKSSSPFSGLFYFAEAEANLRFRDFLTTLAGSTTGTHVQKGVLQAELETLERETLTKFQGDPSGRTTIRVSARLKEARELYERNFLDGAALALVESRSYLDTGSHKDFAEASIPTALAALVERKAPPARPNVPPAQVAVTLVRWPYT